jgi:hypothetical protein
VQQWAASRAEAHLSITNPQAGANLPAILTVSGKGAGLIEGNAVVTAKDSAGRVLAQKATVLLGSSVGVGAEGARSTSFRGQPGAGGLRLPAVRGRWPHACWPG